MTAQQSETRRAAARGAETDANAAAAAAADGPVIARAVYRGRVEWMDTDAGGHHHNTAVIRFVEAAEAGLMRERGLPEYFGSAPRVRYEVEFPSPLWFDQEVTATVVLERIGTSSMTYRFEVWGEAGEKSPRSLAAHGRYVTVHVPKGSHDRHSEPWPECWRKRLGAETGEDHV